MKPAVSPELSLTQRILDQSRSTPSRLAVRLIKDGSGGSETLYWSDILRLARQGAAVLRDRGVRRGARVLLALPTGEAYVTGALGAIWAGMTPATVAVLSNGTNGRFTEARLSEWRTQVAAFSPDVIVGEESLPALDIPRVTPEELQRPLSSQYPPEDNPSDLFYVQFSSGSTGHPKGIGLGWDGIRTNIASMIGRLRLTPDDHIFSWLPMYHDMGFFGTFLLPLYGGFPVTLMDPSQFVSNPLFWFRMTAEHRATITVTPPSALKVSLDLLRRRPISQMDLSSVRQFIVGSEPVPPGLIPHFRETLADYGVGPAAMKPVYGLAETTLGVTMPQDGALPRVDWVDADELERGRRAIPSSGGEGTGQGWVSSGSPIPDMEMSIVSDEDESLPERRIGRILIRSAALMRGTIQEGLFTAREGDWLDTGDLGYMADGDLFVTGRRKDIIIKKGRNYSPERLEDLAALSEGVRRAAAFGLYDDTAATEKVILLVEVASRRGEKAEQRDQIRLQARALLRSAGYEVDEVHIVPRGGLPRTTSGKVRRQHAKALFLRGGFGREEST